MTEAHEAQPARGFSGLQFGKRYKLPKLSKKRMREVDKILEENRRFARVARRAKARLRYYRSHPANSGRIKRNPSLAERKVRARGGALRFRTIKVGRRKQKTLRVAVVCKKGPRGGRTVALNPKVPVETNIYFAASTSRPGPPWRSPWLTQGQAESAAKKYVASWAESGIPVSATVYCRNGSAVKTFGEDMRTNPHRKPKRREKRALMPPRRFRARKRKTHRRKFPQRTRRRQTTLRRALPKYLAPPVRRKRPIRFRHDKRRKRKSMRFSKLVAYRVGSRYDLCRKTGSTMRLIGRFSRQGLKRWAIAHGCKV